MEMLKKFKEKATSFITKGQKKEEMHPSESFLKAVVSSSDSIIAVKDLDAIAQDTFDIEKYEVVIRSLLDLLNKEIQSRRLIKLLMISDYLLKYGCSGCADDLRDHKNVFEQVQRINISESSEQTTILSKKAKHILRMLNEKDLLCKEKVLSQQLKRKLLENRIANGEGLYGQQRSSSGAQDNINQNGNPSNSSSNTGSNRETGNNNLNIKQAAGMAVDKLVKLNDMVEDSFYKYLDDVNDKLDDITGSIGNKIDSIFNRIHLSLTSHQVASLDHSEENNNRDRNGQTQNSQNFQSLTRNNQLTFELEDNPDEEPDIETIKISDEPVSKEQQTTKQNILGDSDITQPTGIVPPVKFGSTKSVTVQNKDLLNLDEQTNIEL